MLLSKLLHVAPQSHHQEYGAADEVTKVVHLSCAQVVYDASAGRLTLRLNLAHRLPCPGGLVLFW